MVITKASYGGSMKLLHNKGAVLLTAVFLATFLSLIIAGVYPLIRANISMSEDNITQSKLYYAAESGANYNIKWLRNLDRDDFVDKEDAKDAAKTYNDSNPALTINGMNVTMSSSVDTTLSKVRWSLTSVSTNPDTGEQCKIQYDSIMAVSGMEYSYFNTFKSKLGGDLIAEQNFYGKSYFNGDISLLYQSDGFATFWGEVDSHHSQKSSGPKNYFNSSVLSQYDYGLSIKEDGKSLSNANDLLDKLVNDAFPYGYNKLVDEVIIEDLVYDWATINGSGSALNVDSLSGWSGGGHDVYLTFERKLLAGIWGSAGYYVKAECNGNIKYIKQDGTYSFITIPGSYKDVHIKGVVDQDISIVTEKSSVYLDDDFYSSDISLYKDAPSSWFNNYDPDDSGHPINVLMSKAQTTHKIGILVALEATNQTDFFINLTPENDGTDVIALTAGLYLPKGRLTGIQPSSWNNLPKLILYGSYFGDTEQGTNNTKHGTGVAPNYVSNPAYLTGNAPPGFKSSQSLDPYSNNGERMFADKITWTLSWL